MSALTEEELALLDFEDQWWRHGGAKEAAIRDLFGTTPTRHYQRLRALIQRPEALAARPVIVRRLQRLLAARAERIASRRAPGLLAGPPAMLRP